MELLPKNHVVGFLGSIWFLAYFLYFCRIKMFLLLLLVECTNWINFILSESMLTDGWSCRDLFGWLLWQWVHWFRDVLWQWANSSVGTKGYVCQCTPVCRIGQYIKEHLHLHFLHVGPRVRGRARFDKHCVWGNNMLLNEDQCLYLNDLVYEFPGVPIKYYVYMMTNSAIIQRNFKMVCYFNNWCSSTNLNCSLQVCKKKQ